MNREGYRKIAKEHGVSVKEVKREMQAAIDAAYKNTDKTDIMKHEQDKIPRSGEIPTTDEFINYVIKEKFKNE